VIVGVTATGDRLHLNPTTVGFAYLLAVVFLSMWSGLRGGILASLLATLAYNYFFLPPRFTFHVDDPRNWVALTAFVVSSLLVTRIVLAARADAARAERRRLEGEADAHMALLRESDAFKTSLLRAVSHDLTTPLTAVRIHIAALARHAATPEVAETVRAIEGETTRLHRRIDNLLTIARLEGGRFRPHPEPTPPADIFHAVRESLATVFAGRPIIIHVGEDCSDAYVDPSLAIEIVVNLVENAHQASPRDVPIELTAGGSGPFVRFEVLDRGPGIPPDSDAPHRGLGLEIARGLTQASGGQFALLPREGGGVIARIDLPAARVGAGEGLDS
jgi:two-component system sensor histidine kinase KdpD